MLAIIRTASVLERMLALRDELLGKLGVRLELPSRSAHGTARHSKRV